MMAILTRYLGPTSTRGSRVKAIVGEHSITLGWDNSLDSHKNHANACRALCEKMGWDGTWHGSDLRKGNRYLGTVWVRVGGQTVRV